MKAEALQPTGSFKVRGAWNHLSTLSHKQKKRGVLALSAGNHGRAVAWAAQRFSIERTVILMPTGGPSFKVESIRQQGADIVFFDPHTVDRQEMLRHWTEEEGLHFVPPFDDPLIIAGAGTVAMEMVEDARKSGVTIDAFFAACSGGGLVAGSALSLEALSPATELWAVEPEDFDDTARSLEAGQRVTLPTGGRTICDTLMSPTPGKITFEINRNRIKGVVRARDELAKRGMMAAFSEFGLAAEPSGALALGAVLADRSLTRNRTVAVVLSGRNVSPADYLSCLQGIED